MSNRRPSWLYPLVLLIFAIVLVVNAIALFNQNPTWVGIAGVLLAVFPGLGFVFQLAIKHDLRVYLAVQYLLSKRSSKTINWDLTVRITSPEITVDSVKKIEDALLLYDGDSKKIRVQRSSSGVSEIIIEPGPIVNVTYYAADPSMWGEEEAEPYSYIVLYLKSYTVSRSDLPGIIKDEVIPTVEIIVNTLSQSNTNCTLNIDFRGKPNPFYGLFIANLPPNAVADYSVRIQPYGVNNHTSVYVTKNKIIINSQSREAVKSVAIQFLTFSSTLREYLT